MSIRLRTKIAGRGPPYPAAGSESEVMVAEVDLDDPDAAVGGDG